VRFSETQEYIYISTVENGRKVQYTNGWMDTKEEQYEGEVVAHFHA
jgi:hypothetical protein